MQATTTAARPARGSSLPESRFGVFGVGTHLVGIPSEAVQEMFVLREVHRPPGMPVHQRGVAVLRGHSLPAVDLRVCLGLPPSESERDALVTLLREREQDHRTWLAELEAAVRERRAFGLTTDPRRCKFGVWYHAFRTDDPVLRSELARFEKPHAEIHAVARTVGALQGEGKHDAAAQLVAATRAGRLADLVRLFEGMRATVAEQFREIGVLVRSGGRELVLAVDRAEAVTDLAPLAEGEDPVRSGALRPDFVAALAQWRGRAQPVLLLDLARVAALLP